MSAKFFNNTGENTLFNKIKGIAQGMVGFERFLAVVGFFRSSGYFKLRAELPEDVKEIKILVGINIDDIFRKHNKALLMLSDGEKAKELYRHDFMQDIVEANYTQEVEQGILQMCDDLMSGRLQMRIHDTKNLHAKFYLCLPANHTENSDGWVIMGSSNISDAGLGIGQAPRYELNVAMKDYDDVHYCYEEFNTLWEQSVVLSLDDIATFKKKTYLGEQPTPYELYIKVLIDTFGEQVEDDFTMQLPEGVKDLKYQKDAVIQGYQMLMQHNGLFLADVVGLGKTMIATMIAKRYIEANGKNTNVLVIYPPALEENWRNTFKQFGISKKAQFVSNGSLSKVLEEKGNYKTKEEFDLVIVDEAHGFRSDSSDKYDELQKICKSPCFNPGLLHSNQKKVMLLSATPLNNRPEDLLNQLLLFQNSQTCTIDGIPNLKAFFNDYIQAYRKLMSEREKRDVTDEVNQIYEAIRERVIDKVTVRRTRQNILNDADYQADITAQGIAFPRIEPPHELVYQMSPQTSALFYETLTALSDEQYLTYARYRAIEFIKTGDPRKSKNALHVGKTLAGIYRVHMVKRLESSFYAFKRSLHTLLSITNGMIQMFEEDKVIIANELKVKDLQAKGMELDEILELAMGKGIDKDDILFQADDFEPEFKDMLLHDKAILEDLVEKWDKEGTDPKYDLFYQQMQDTFFNPALNISGKLVIFSESVDTLNYLHERLAHERTDILCVSAKNRKQYELLIKQNFDANYADRQDKYNIILTSDVLAEGVNLHRSNVIVNYDSPWNATRLMQRIGRVNRIGSVADKIYNYMFYPSQQGDKEIQLYKNALIKLQGFHSAFGEDAQIYSREEIVKQFQLFDNTIKDSTDERIKLLREVRTLYTSDRKLYNKIKGLPLKSRVMRNTGKRAGSSIVFVSSNVKTEFYQVTDKEVVPIDFISATKILRAKPDESSVPFPKDTKHYEHVNRALQSYTSTVVETSDTTSINLQDLDKTSQRANKFVRNMMQLWGKQDPEFNAKCNILINYLKEGVYQQLPRKIQKLAKTYKNEKKMMSNYEDILKNQVTEWLEEYHTTKQKSAEQNASATRIIISETFI